MEGLSSRQTQILKALIDEYLETADPVGSLALEKKYNLGVSPATIRNEMANLTANGYLKQPHTSAGRVPTPMAMKFYIHQLMDERKVGLAEEVRAKEHINSTRTNIDHMMREATLALSQNTHSLAVATMDDGSVWAHGHSHLFSNPEFLDHLVCQSVFAMLERERMLHELFFVRLTGLSPIEILFGEELGWQYFELVGIVASRFHAKGHDFALGVIGPFRLNYAQVIPSVRYFGDLVHQTLEQG